MTTEQTLRQVLTERLDAEELRTFCYELQIDYDNLAGEGKSGKVRELILYLERRDRLLELISIGDQLRPDIPWRDIPDLQDAGVISPAPSGPSLQAPESAAEPMPPCPYRGLSAFRRQDAPYFYGRDSATDLLVETVLRFPAVVAVIGPSGSGKTSLVSAGLLPTLCQSDAEGRTRWLVAHSRPGSNPFEELADAMLPLLEPGMSEMDLLIEVPKAAKALRGGDLGLSLLVKHTLQNNPGAESLLLILDQFEELYTLCSDAATRNAFLEVLLESLPERRVPQEPALVLLLTLRADFLGQVLSYRPLADMLDEAQTLMLGPMNQEELEAAIVCPAEKQGVAFESGLPDRIVGDVGTDPGNLPLLEFALTQLWERQRSGLLTHEAYEALGKVEGALKHYANLVFRKLSTAERERARRIFVQLVRPGDRTEDTRRLATREELGEEDWVLVQRLADARLLVTGRDPSGQAVVEVVHEALIHGWGRLRSWMDEDRDFRIWQEQLRARLQQWKASGRNQDILLHGIQLDEAEQWLVSREKEFAPLELEFIRASQEWQSKEERRRQARIERIRDLQEEVITSKKLAILGTAMASLQHRISNTFNIIVPNITRLRRRIDTSDQTVLEILDVIERNTRYTSENVERILDPLREVGVEQININTLLTDVAHQARELWGTRSKPIDIILSLDDSVPLITAPSGQLTEVFQNLIDNACRAVEDNDRITITTQLSDDHILARVIDTGPGIPPSMQDRLFKKPVPSGPGQSAGLGLWLSKLILSTIGADIGIEQTGPDGTTMYVKIPVRNDVDLIES